MKNKDKNNNLKWIFLVSQRFARVDRKGKSAVTSVLATLGICFGVMTLIIVMSVMNGFQMSFIDSILELSSYHVQAKKTDLSVSEKQLQTFCENNKNILSVSPYYEAQTLMTSEYNKESAAIIRAVDPDCYFYDDGFSSQLRLRRGSFDLEEPNSIIIGSTLARNLGVAVGDVVNLFVLSGSDDVSLFSNDRNFEITGIFTCGYSELNASYCFINLADGEKYFGNDATITYGIKIADKEKDALVISQLKKNVTGFNYSSWREYNKSFFGALRIEKNMLMLLVALIFVVVGINIYNGMRRLVFERRSEIAILSALGAETRKIQSIFIVRGFTTGFIGAISGLILGLLISVNTDFVFSFVSSLMFWVQYIITSIFSPQNLVYVQENSTYALYASIPARIFYKEVVFIFLFGMISPLFASWVASKNVLKMTIAEVLHHE